MVLDGLEHTEICLCLLPKVLRLKSCLASNFFFSVLERAIYNRLVSNPEIYLPLPPECWN